MTLRPMRAFSYGVIPVLLLAGCATQGHAPVTDRSAAHSGQYSSPTSASGDSSAEIAPRPGFYVVKRGDTLYSIAQQHRRSVRELVALNQLDNPNVIEVGQELRVSPADTGVAVKPIATQSQPEARPVDAGRPLAPLSDKVKREPKGGRVPYSEQALADAQKAGTSATKPADTRKPVDTKPVDTAKASAPVPDKTADKTAVVADGVDWGWPASGKVAQGFSESGSKGLDIAGKLGDPVYAAAGGKVVYAGSGLRGYGKLLIVKHDANYLSAYAHNQQLLVKEGQSITKGQKIAEMGNSDADKPMLHFEIRKQGKPVDPSKYLPVR